MILISVIVPVYNVEKYLCRCVDSILKQTLSSFELILVDDGSPDKSGTICDGYAERDGRIKVLHKRNGGLSSARNAGLDIANGEYVCFIDSDDVIHPETLESLLDSLKSNNADIAIGDFCRFRENTELSFQMDMNGIEAAVCSGEQILEKLYDKDVAARYVSICGKLIKRTLFTDVRFPIGRLFEDEFTTYRLYYKSAKTVVLEKKLYYYFVNLNGITQNLTLQKRFDEYDAQWERIIFYKENDLKAVYHKALLHFLDSARWSLISYRNKSEEFDEMRGKKFERQYSDTLRLAQKENLLEFMQHYDYYVLGKPKYILYYRIKRKFWNGIQIFNRKG